MLWIGCLQYAPAFAQGLAEVKALALSKTPSGNDQDNKQSLRSILKKLEETHQVNFYFNPDVVDDKYVEEIVEDEGLEQTLERLLSPLQLQYTKLEDRYYVIQLIQQKGNVLPKLDKRALDVPRNASPSTLAPSSWNRLSPSKQVLEQTISGKVVSLEDDEPLPGVNVLAKGTNTGTVTDVDGNYQLSVPDEVTTLVFSSIGFVTEEVEIGGRSVIDVALASDIQSLQEVVVVGYGTVSKKDLTGAVATLDVVESSKQVTSTSPLENLQGRVAGVDVTSASGAPGAGVNIRIRGVGTINDNTPLYVVDGVFTSGNLNNINPSDIASVQVLKDASAAAIYGSRAANGVVIITTKQGREGKTQFNLNAYYGFTRPTNLYPLVNSQEYAMLNNRARLAAGRDPLLPNLPPSEGGTFDPSISTDWQEEVYGGDRPVQKYDLSASGGNQNGQYYLSLGYFNQEGILINTGVERFSARLNSSFQKGILKIGENLNVARTARTQAVSGFRDVEVETIRMPPTVPVLDPSNLGGFAGTGPEYDVVVANPVGHQLLKDNADDAVSLLGNIYGELDLLPGLNYRLNLGFDAAFNHNKFYVPEYFMSNQDNSDVNNLSEGRGVNFTWLIENTLNYNKTVGDHSLGVLLGTSAQSTRSSNVSVGVQQIPGGGTIRVPGAGQVINNVGGGISEYTLESYFGRLNYSFDDRYLFTFNVRRDGTSRFIEENRWGTFPSASAAWRISEENFFEPLSPIVNDLKLRVSYGALGNQSISNYATSSNLNLYSGYPLGGPGDPGISDLGSLTPGFTITNLANPNIQWETTTTKDIGIDASLFDNKISVTADYYSRLTSDMLVRIPIPRSVGVSNSPFFNVGSIENRGFEFSATYFKTEGDFKFDITANFATLNNEVLQLSGREDESDITGGAIESSVYRTTRTRVGSEVGAFYLYEVLGIYQNESEVETNNPIKGRDAAPGDLIYRDVNGDSLLNNDDLVYMGSAIPKLQGGLNFAGSYKNFDLSVFFQGVYGNKVYDALKYWTEGGFGNFNYSQRMLDAWTPENTDTNIPRLVFGDPARNGREPSNRWLEDGSFLRLKNIQLGYTVPAALLERISPDANLRFYVSATNLLTFTRYTGYDPEIGRDGKTNRGVDRGSYPISKTFVGGLQFNF